MKSFKQYISENWSHATPEDMSDENAHKYLFHVTSEKGANEIVTQGKLEPKPYKHVLDTIKFLETRPETDQNAAESLRHFRKRSTNTYVMRSGGDPQLLRQAIRNYSEMKGDGNARVVKFPIANLSRNLARNLEVEPSGNKVTYGIPNVPWIGMTKTEPGDKPKNPEDNVVALTVRGPIENKFTP